MSGTPASSSARLARVPIYGVAGFVTLYAAAAWLYPGGTRADPTRVGFSFADNYWCDLLDVVTYGGQPNAARPVALGATLLLSFALSALWWTVPALSPQAPKRAALVRAAGLASALVTPFIASPKHDLAIRAAGLFGLVAFVATMTALPFAPRDPLRWVTRLALAACVLDYGVWETRTGPRLLPMIQKAAFFAFLLWVILLARRTARTLSSGEDASEPRRSQNLF